MVYTIVSWRNRRFEFCLIAASVPILLGEACDRLGGLSEVLPSCLFLPDGFGVGDAEGRRRVLVHASGFQQSPYADVKPAGGSITSRKLWHSSPGSSGR